MSAEEIYYLLYSKVLSSHEAFQHIEYHETLAKIASLNATSKLQEILHEYIDSIKEYK